MYAHTFPILSFNTESNKEPLFQRVKPFVRSTQTYRTAKSKDSKVDIMEASKAIVQYPTRNDLFRSCVDDENT